MKINKEDKEQAKKRLLEILSKKDKVFYIVTNVSPSGMYRHIYFCTFKYEKGEIRRYWLSGLFSSLLGYPIKKNDSLGVGGCGMDMGFHIISQVSSELFEDYKILKYELL
jgi:hypothetical protein